MQKKQQAKDRLRKEVSSLKKGYIQDDLYNRSVEVLSVLEITGVFQDAKTILIYNSLQDEVQTADFIEKWDSTKDFYLPVIEKDEIVFRKYTSSIEYKQSSIGVMEPVGENFMNYNKVDLIIIPGVAFDRKKNRMGRGKGYYDRFLSKMKAPKMGICFEFQLFDDIPNDENDVKMDYIVPENELIW
ncbi:MAG: 5-formyltetrahydrofolate cyclo-ligase [Dysgonomonas sp.]